MPNKSYRAGVRLYSELGYWDPGYSPPDTDVLCCFRVTPQPGSARRRLRPQ